MVNLRFHIVSITAVFLALAVGIVMGSTLLQRATVDSLKSRQSSLEEKIDDRVVENNAFRAQIGAMEDADEEFASDPMPPLTEDTVAGDVVLVAVRGIDEGRVSAIEADLETAGANLAGVVWLTDALDVADEGRRRGIAEALDAPGALDGPDDARLAVVSHLRDTLSGPMTPVGEPSPDAGDTPPIPEPAAELERLDEQGLIAWEPAPGADTRTLPSRGLRVVVATGEGADPGPDDLVIPLLSALAADRPGGTVAVEIMNPRSRVGEIDRDAAGDEPQRGDFVDQIRDDDALAAAVTTIDDGDRPFGRLALVLVLADPDRTDVGHYGETESAERSFPPGP